MKYELTRDQKDVLQHARAGGAHYHGDNIHWITVAKQVARKGLVRWKQDGLAWVLTKKGKDAIGELGLNPMKGQPTTLQCNFCGKVFKRVIGPKTYEIQCPKCKETDAEVIGNPGATWHALEYEKADKEAMNHSLDGNIRDFDRAAGRRSAHFKSYGVATSERMPNPSKRVKEHTQGAAGLVLVIGLIAGLAWLSKKQ